MSSTSYLKIKIGGEEVDVSSIEDLPVAISYKLEDRDDFQTKRNSNALSIKVPATLKNDQIFNTFHDPSVEDNSPNNSYTGNRPVVIEASGAELLAGKAILNDVEEDSAPISYEFDCFGGNADWAIDLKEATLYDFVKHITFTFTKAMIIASWAYDGTDENLPYSFIPIRYRDAMDDEDTNMRPAYMKPSLSKYWILYWGFKSLGYQIQSDFFDTGYFRRQMMPWTWGNFLFSDGTRTDALRFLARSVQEWGEPYHSYNNFVDLFATNDSQNGAFNNNNVYSYDAGNKEMKWTYVPSIQYGTLEAHFHVLLNVDAAESGGNTVDVNVRWYKNGVLQQNDNVVHVTGPDIGIHTFREFIGDAESWFVCNVVPGDVVSCKVYLVQNDIATFGMVRCGGKVESFELEYFRIPMGGTIDFSGFNGFKKWKFLDFLRGVVDEFNLSVQTDAVSKIVYMEPTHPYSLTDDLSTTVPGYFTGNTFDWQGRRDLTKRSKTERFRDYERELIFKFKDDNNDGILKLIQDRNQCTLAASKYVLPERFKEGKKDIENRFFSPVMHYEVAQWKDITGVAPQLICMIPENISNTSREEAQNTFAPKSVYYKGYITGVGGWKFDGDNYDHLPFAFAVNYKDGGQDDPILSYSDELIGTVTPVVGKGLLRRFYLQRMAIMREGKNYTTFFHLNNKDVLNYRHREHIISKGLRWELIEINGYKPLKDESTQCFLRKWEPVMEKDGNSVFPSQTTISTGAVTTNPFDTKYSILKCLSSDIPT